MGKGVSDAFRVSFSRHTIIPRMTNSWDPPGTLYPQEPLALTNPRGWNATICLRLHPGGPLNISKVYFVLQGRPQPVPITSSHVALFIADAVLSEFHTLPSSLFNPPTIRRAPLPATSLLCLELPRPH
jgi:hypothetical protein